MRTRGKTTTMATATAAMLLLACLATVCQGAFWLEEMEHNGLAAYNPKPDNYKVFRNVKDYGAKGDGSTDDAEAINAAITDGTRCGEGCDSSTTTPALIYFPAGTYIVSTPIVPYYFSQLVGDPTDVPVLKATANFEGIAVIDSDPYSGEDNWFFNTNNFYRMIRNFVIDLTDMTAGTGIHWQVAQATSLTNIVFEMKGTQSQGIFMDNGSGGYMTDLTFNGGKIGAFLGNQQFTSRNLVFNGCDTAVVVNWNWAWTFKSLAIDNCKVGVDVSLATMGSVVIIDSVITNTPIGILALASDEDRISPASNTLMVDNLETDNVPQIVATPDGDVLLKGSSGAQTVAGWGKGRTIDFSTGEAVEAHMEGEFVPFDKPQALLNAEGKLFERTRPQYEDLSASDFVSARASGAKGDGVADDTVALQKLLDDHANGGKVIFLDHGYYRITDTLTVRPGTRITGEVWANLVAAGEFFSDPANPQVMLQVGLPDDKGVIELSDMVVMSEAPAGGAILIEWNNADPEDQQGVSGMWDVHARVGGAAGTKMQSDICAKDPSGPGKADPACMAAFMLMHVGKTGGVYMENDWLWTSDHELDLEEHTQVTVYAGRGFWSESEEGPIWMYGTASEHNVLYQYQFTNTKNVFMGHIQTETPYYQSNPGVSSPFETSADYSDPEYSCPADDLSCAKSWGLRIYNSKDILVGGAGLYSFFENWDQGCLDSFPQTCQTRMTSIEGSSSNIVVYNMNTVGTTNMITVDGVDAGIQTALNNNTFAHTAALVKVKSSASGTPTPTSSPKPKPTSTPKPTADGDHDDDDDDTPEPTADDDDGDDTPEPTADETPAPTDDDDETPQPTDDAPAPTSGAPSSCKLEEDTDFFGFDIGRAESKQAADCCDLCKDTDRCVGFTWAEGFCYFKDVIDKSAPMEGSTSGRV